MTISTENFARAINSAQVERIYAMLGHLAHRAVSILKAGGHFARLHPVASLIAANLVFAELTLQICRIMGQILNEIRGNYVSVSNNEKNRRFYFLIGTTTYFIGLSNIIFIRNMGLAVTPLMALGISLGTTVSYYGIKTFL